MFETKLTKHLGIQYPIIQGGMMWVSKAELVAAVSNAGGLGIMTALSFESPKRFAEEIEKTRELTSKPFGINLTFLPTLKPVPYEDYLEVILSKGIKILETAGRSPEPYMSTIRKADITVIHKCTTVRHAIKAQKIGCHFVSIDGFECAGHPGEEDVTSLILIPAAVDALEIPVIASGGFGDGRGLVAALALGAQGINMGTRFLATTEAPVHPNIKQTLVDSKENETLLVLRSLRNTARVLKNSTAQQVFDMENKGAGLSELAPLISGRSGKESLETGVLDHALLSCGQVTGLIRDVPTVAELIERIIFDAKKIVTETFH